jgi:hypothetical protein
MRIKKPGKFVQKKLTHMVAEQIQRSRPVSVRSPHGECWPQSSGREKTIMWQSTGWPASGKNIPRDTQR